VKKEFNPLMSH